MTEKRWEDFRTKEGFVFRMFDVSGDYRTHKTPDGEPANFMAEVYRVFEHMCLERKLYHMETLGYIGLAVKDLTNIRDVTEQINSGLAKLVK